MSVLDTGIYGAKVQSWKRANPRDLLRGLIEKMGPDNKEALYHEFKDIVTEDGADEFLDSIIEYWFANNYHSLIERPTSTKETRAKSAAQTKNVKAAISKAIERKARMILLDMVLPNGKALRDCTGAECASLGARVGTWLESIAEQLKPKERVGDVFSETQVRKLYRVSAN